MVEINNVELHNMQEAYEFVKELYENKPWDIWFEKRCFSEYIWIEDVFNSTKQVRLTSLEEVKKFVDKGELRKNKMGCSLTAPHILILQVMYYL